MQQAVESSVSELEEATFGRGKWFDIKDDKADQENLDIQVLRELLMEEFHRSKARKQVSECMINAAVFGTGVAELVLDEEIERTPATRPALDGMATAYGVEERPVIRVKVKPVLPKQFLIDPVATCIEDALGCIIDEYVPVHQVQLLQDRGVYLPGDIGSPPQDSDIEADEELAVYADDKCRLTKYYGLVPREALKAVCPEVEDSTDRYVEACIVIANGEYLLKAIPNPYMMQDRPVIAFQWDVVPGRFWGRGVCEKGYMSQKALDTEMRARIDALALVVHSMSGGR